MCADPKVQKKTDSLTVFFVLLESSYKKAAHKTLVKLTPGLIPAFLDMIRRNDKHLRRKNPRVFVSSIFEIEKNAEMPQTKKELIPLLKNNTVIPFHKKVCSQCHAIPKSKEWIKAPVTGDYIRDPVTECHMGLD